MAAKQRLVRQCPERPLSALKLGIPQTAPPYLSLDKALKLASQMKLPISWMRIKNHLHVLEESKFIACDRFSGDALLSIDFQI